MLFEATKCVISCYNSNRKLIHPLSRLHPCLHYLAPALFWALHNTQFSHIWNCFHASLVILYTLICINLILVSHLWQRLLIGHLTSLPTHSLLLPHSTVAGKANTLSNPFLQLGMAIWPSSGKARHIWMSAGRKKMSKENFCFPGKREDITNVTIYLSSCLKYQRAGWNCNSCHNHEPKVKRSTMTWLWFC